MFSRIYQSARALLTDSTQNRSLSPASAKQSLQTSPEMVTSRSQSRAARRDDEVNDDNTIQSSGQKRKLRSSGVGHTEEGEEEEVATPVAAKKRKILPVREKGSSPVVKNTIPVVEIPARKATPEFEANVGTPAKPIEIEDDVEESSDEDISVEDIEDKAEESKDIEVEVEVNTTTKHKRFDSEEAEPELFSTAREDPEAGEEVADSDEDSDSEDDAPEAIGIQDAAKEVKSKERDTAKAMKDQLSASRKKRKERDEILKKQSEKSKKRKPISTTNEPEVSSSDSEDEPAASRDEPTSLTMPSQTLTSRSTLPSFLPAEYLEDNDPQNLIPTTDETTIVKKKAKKTKFLDAALKEPKDRRVGKTTYRVAKAGSTKLAPKSSFTARSTKEAWMQGRSGGKVDPSRRAFGKAFGRR